MQLWFDLLDRRPIRVDGAKTCVSQVTGIHLDGPDLWIQIEPVGRPDRSRVLHVCSHTVFDDVKAALEAAWSESGTDQTVIDLTEAA